MGIESGGCYAELLVTHARQAMAVPGRTRPARRRRRPRGVPHGVGRPRRCRAASRAGAGRSSTPGRRVSGRRRSRSSRRSAPTSPSRARRARRSAAPSSAPTSSSSARPPTGSASLREALRRVGADGVDVVLDVVGGEEVDRNLRGGRDRAARSSRSACSAAASATVNVGALLAKRVTWIGTVLRSRPLEEKIAVSRRFAAEVLPLFTAGRLRPVIDRRFALDDVAEAHRVMEADANVGKLRASIERCDDALLTGRIERRIRHRADSPTGWSCAPWQHDPSRKLHPKRSPPGAAIPLYRQPSFGQPARSREPSPSVDAARPSRR